MNEVSYLKVKVDVVEVELEQKREAKLKERTERACRLKESVC